jgi:hypothetical protein
MGSMGRSLSHGLKILNQLILTVYFDRAKLLPASVLGARIFGLEISLVAKETIIWR